MRLPRAREERRRAPRTVRFSHSGETMTRTNSFGGASALHEEGLGPRRCRLSRQRGRRKLSLAAAKPPGEVFLASAGLRWPASACAGGPFWR